MSEPVHALIPAAGRGARFGGSTAKQLLRINGRTLLEWAVLRLREAGVASVVVAAPAELQEEIGQALVAGRDGLAMSRVVLGGATRQESVRHALSASPAGPGELILVHDAARPAVHPEDVSATIAAASATGGAILGRPVTDTLKRVGGEVIEQTVPREGLFRAETPQVFRRELFERACREAEAVGFVGTDEASLVERLQGARIAAVSARWPNPKVTYEQDLAWARMLLTDAAQ